MICINNRLTFFILLLICIIAFTACGANFNGHELVGIWEHDGNRIEFTKHGYFIKGEEKYPFSVNENKITIDEKGAAMTVEYSINANGTMTMNGIIHYPVQRGK